MEGFTRRLLRHPRKILAAFLLLTVFFTLEIRHLTLDPSMEVFIPEDHPEVVFFREMKKSFGLFNFVIVGVVDERAGGVYRPETLHLVRDLCLAFEELPHVTQVLGIYDFPYIEGDAEGMNVVPLMTDEEEMGQAWIEALRDRIADWPMLTGTLVSRDGNATGILVRYERETTPEVRYALYHAILEAIARVPAPNQQIFVAGMTAIEVNIADYIVRDMKVLLPIVYGVVILCLWLSFRRPLGVLLPLLTVVISTLWTMGIMALTRVPLNTLTGCLPVLLTAVGTAYTIHILFHFLHNATGSADRREALVRSVSQVGFAVIATGLTTVGGFASLGVSQVMPIRYFGIFAAVGTLVGLLSSITLVPAILQLVLNRIRIPASSPGAKGEKGLDRALRRYVRFVTRHRRTVYLCSLLLSALCVWGATRIYAESDYVTLFRKSSYIWQSDQMINRYFNGSSILSIMVLTGEPDALKEPEVLRRMDALQRFTETLPHVGGTLSLADYIKRMNQSLNAGDPAHHRIPDTREMVAQCLLLYTLSGDESDLEEVTNHDYSTACITVNLKSGSTRYAGELVRRIEAFNAENTRLPIHMTASMVLGKVVDDLTIRGQLETMILSTLVVLILVALILRSFTAGLLGILPLLLCILMNFGILGWTGTALMMGTATIASVALGIGIDYAIHFLNMARIRARGAASIEQALEDTAGTAGRAIVYNAAAVGFGFLVMVFSLFKGDIYFGAFITLTMFTASLATLTVLPCLIRTVRPAFLLNDEDAPPDRSAR